MARNRPITMRSWALNPLLSVPLACPFALSEMTPSSVVTKLLNTCGCERGSGTRRHPYRRARLGGSGSTLSGFVSKSVLSAARVAGPGRGIVAVAVHFQSTYFSGYRHGPVIKNGFRMLVPRPISFALFEPPRIAGRLVAHPRHRTTMAAVCFARAARAQLRKSGSRYLRKPMGRGTRHHSYSAFGPDGLHLHCG